jgi:hypothetical protein
VAGSAFLLVWGHGMLTGSDTTALRAVYAGTGAVVAALAASRYLSGRERA